MLRWCGRLRGWWRRICDYREGVFDDTPASVAMIKTLSEHPSDVMLSAAKHLMTNGKQELPRHACHDTLSS